MVFLVFFSPSSYLRRHSKLFLKQRREKLVFRRVSEGRLGGRISKGIGDGVLMAHVMTAGPRSGAGGLLVYWLPH